LSSVVVWTSVLEVAVGNEFGFVETDEQQCTAFNSHLHSVRHNRATVDGGPELHLYDERRDFGTEAGFEIGVIANIDGFEEMPVLDDSQYGIDVTDELDFVFLGNEIE
jgi:hypothetical protein